MKTVVYNHLGKTHHDLRQEAYAKVCENAVTRYVVTHTDKVTGMRTLAHAQQGRHTYETAEKAQEWIDAAVKNNGLKRLSQFYGLPLEVRPCACWPGHFDPIGVWFD